MSDLSPAPLSEGKDRLAYLDNLRASLTALVICHHCNAAYGSIGGWSYVVRESGGPHSELLATLFAGVTQAFFMSSFFLLSAYFTAPAYDHKGAVGFARRRLVRLGIPIVFYYYVLSLLLNYMVMWFEGHQEQGLIEFFSTYFLRRGSPGPLWFAMTLLFFEGFYIVFRQVSDRVGRIPRSYALPNDRQILGFILGIGVFTFVFRQWWPLTVHFFHMRLAFFPLYVCMFTLGVIAYRSGWFEQFDARQANRWFRVSLWAIAIAPVVIIFNAWLGYDAYKFWSGFNWQCCTYAVWEAFLCVGINLKLVVWYRDRLNRSTPFTRRMARSAYTAYILHAFFICAWTYVFTFFSLGRIPEILLMWPVAVASCFLFSDAVRRIPLLKQVLT